MVRIEGLKVIQVHTAQTQQKPNVYKQVKLNYQEYAVRTGNHLYSGNYSTAEQGVVTISCSEAVEKHCNLIYI